MTANGKAGLNPYDEVPYPNFAYSATHPDSLATVATLLGVEPAPVDHCRVLELGCASGGNLIPMAQGLPHSEFIGVDFSAHQIASGQRAAAALGLKNVTLWHMNILDVLSADLGQFDYIVAHGIFSWVPRDVQEAILEICHQHLAPYGIAYVSYNVYPGWHMMGAIREMMLYHTRDVTEPPLRAAQARALLDFLAQSIPADGSPHSSLLSTYSSFLKRETEHIHGSPDAYLLHDELEEINAPIYFYQFAERAACHGLQYLSEVELSSVMPANFPPEVSANLFKLARDVVEMEQYMDFLRNRTFRKTLLCHQSIPVNRTLKANRVMGMHIASRARPVSAQPDLNSAGVEKFTSSSDGATFTTDHPVTKTAMTLLSEIWPHAMFFDTLLDTARARLNAINPSQPDADTRALDAHTLAANLLKGHAYSANLVELHVYPPQLITEVSERPIASPWARLQADDMDKVTNLRHERVDLGTFERYLLRHLDGRHDRSALLEALAKPLADGSLVVHKDNQPVENVAEANAIIADELEQNLQFLAQAALLVG